MSPQDLAALLERLRREPQETEWLEFKENRCEPEILGEYLSALANAACLVGKSRGYLVFGIQDQTHDVVGTQFNPQAAKAKGNQDLLIWLAMGLQPNIGFEVHTLEHPRGRVIMFEVRAAWDQPVKFYGTAFIRVGSSKTELHKHPEKERAIWSRRTDWSAHLCEKATVKDLDPTAIAKAREQFLVKHPGQALELAGWDDQAFLNKAKLTVQGAITNTSILLLGKPESSTLLSPAVGRISWILKDDQNREMDYEHFGPPFLLQVDRVLARIRNLNVRTLPSGTLFPQEITQYEPWVLREALHNAIAHQDYTLRGRVNIVETPTSLLITNAGNFLPGEVEKVIQQDAPQEIYRNPFLAEAMVNLNMIDTQGGGIKRMFQKQMERFFPLPDFNLSDPDRVQVTIPGNILDEQYTRILMARTDLALWQVILLDRVQKRLPISQEAHRLLKSSGLVEGRYPNPLIAAGVARLTGQKARHIRERGFAKQYYLDAIESLVREHQPIPRSEIDSLLLDKLPEVLSEAQKRAKIHNLMAELVRLRKIVNRGSRGKPLWHAAEPPSN
jgi:ATP-dependent DNA helicase RecG